jgi:hypothetical protein
MPVLALKFAGPPALGQALSLETQIIRIIIQAGGCLKTQEITQHHNDELRKLRPYTEIEIESRLINMSELYRAGTGIASTDGRT